MCATKEWKTYNNTSSAKMQDVAARCSRHRNTAHQIGDQWEVTSPRSPVRGHQSKMTSHRWPVQSLTLFLLCFSNLITLLWRRSRFLSRKDVTCHIKHQTLQSQLTRSSHYCIIGIITDNWIIHTEIWRRI